MDLQKFKDINYVLKKLMKVPHPYLMARYCYIYKKLSENDDLYIHMQKCTQTDKIVLNEVDWDEVHTILNKFYMEKNYKFKIFMEILA